MSACVITVGGKIPVKHGRRNSWTVNSMRGDPESPSQSLDRVNIKRGELCISQELFARTLRNYGLDETLFGEGQYADEMPDTAVYDISEEWVTAIEGVLNEMSSSPDFRTSESGQFLVWLQYWVKCALEQVKEPAILYYEA